VKRLLSMCKWLALTTCLASVTAIADSELNTPFFSSNLNPLVQVYGLPTTRGAVLADKSQWKAGVQLEAANTFSNSDSSQEAIFLDGETYRATLLMTYGLTDKIELNVELPYLSHDGGQLDSLIEDWHSFWDLPNGDRDDFPQDQLMYAYRYENDVLVNLQDSESGMGDISLMMGYQLAANEQTEWALRGGVKLATGDADKLTGSESTDIHLGLYVSRQSLFEQPSLYAHANIGVLWMDDGEVAEELREDWVGYGSTSLSWMVSRAISLKAQLDFHTAFYDSALEEIGDFTAQLVLGGSIRASKNTVVDLSMSEDIVVNASPDVVFQLGLRATF
jgi:hypothetical protein